jgi:hypothetical protein
MTTSLASDADIRAVTRCLLSTERAVVRLRRRFPAGTACSKCVVTHPSALILESDPVLCYACRLGRDIERNHAAGSGRGPILELPANAHRVFSEVEALRRRFLTDEVGREVGLGLVTYAAMRVAALGSWQGQPLHQVIRGETTPLTGSPVFVGAASGTGCRTRPSSPLVGRSNDDERV